MKQHQNLQGTLQFSTSWMKTLAENSSKKRDLLCHGTYTQLSYRKPILRDKSHVYLYSDQHASGWPQGPVSGLD